MAAKRWRLPDGPGFWLYETSGLLRPAVERFLEGRPLTDRQIVVLRAYLRQWIESDVWSGADVDELRAGVDRLTSRGAIDVWLQRALKYGIDPL